MTKEAKKKSVAGIIGSVMFIMLAGKLAGFFREILITSEFGTGTLESASFNFASYVPSVFFDFTFASAITASFVPIFNDYYTKDGRDKAFSLAQSFITLVFLLSLVLAVVLTIFSPAVVEIFAGAMNTQTKDLTIDLLRILFPTIVFSALAFCVAGVLQSLNKFSIPAAMSVVSNVIIIAYYFLFMDRFGIYGLTVAFLIGWSFQLFIQIPTLLKNGFRFRFSIKNEGLKKIFKLMLPVMVSSWVIPVNNFVNYTSAMGLFDGTAKAADAILSANRLYSVITGVLILSVSNVIFQMLSKSKSANDDKSYSDTLKGTLRFLSFALIPMTFGLIVLGQDIIALAYERNAFDAVSTSLTAEALSCFAIGMLGFGFFTILSRGFFADKNGKIPFITSLLIIALNYILSVVLVKVLGIKGPALASSIAISVGAVIMFVAESRKNKAIADKQMLYDMIKIIFSSLIMFVVIYYLKLFIPQQSLFLLRIAVLSVSVLVGILIYFILVSVLKVKEAVLMRKAISGFFAKAGRKH